MTTYPIEADKLLDAVDLLAPAAVGRGRPGYTAHRVVEVVEAAASAEAIAFFGPIAMQANIQNR